MKPCADCKNPQACAKAAKCAATGKPLAQAPAKPMAKPRKTGQFYIQP